MPLPLHAGHVGPPPLETRLLVALVAGVLATVVATVPVQVQSEGTTPSFVAVAVLTRSEPADVSSRTASAVHHVGGVLAALAHALSAVGLEALLGPETFLASVRLYVAPHLLAGLLLLGVLFGGFAYVVLPLAGGEVHDRAARVRTQWLVTATVYVAALLAAVPAVTAVLA